MNWKCSDMTFGREETKDLTNNTVKINFEMKVKEKWG